jgi:mRNA interferase MazF
VRPGVIVTNNVYNERVPVIQVVPITGWSEKKGRIKTNVEIMPSSQNGLSKKSVVDCLQTRPIDHRYRLVKIRGELTVEEMKQINEALKIIFAL